MAEFNPYQAWLQVPITFGETPTYYKLLGLAEFEEDTQAISKASEKQLSRLLAINPEKHRSQWQKLINDLAEAQSTLTHPQHKTSYDNRLRGVTEPAADVKPVVTKPIIAEPISTPTPAPSSPVIAAAPVHSQPYQVAATSTPAPQAPAPYAPNQGYPAYGQPSYPNPSFPNPNYPNPASTQPPQYGQPVYAQPVYGQQPPPTPVAPPYGQPPYGQAPYAQPQQPVYGQPVYAQPVYGQPVAPAPYAQPVYGQPVYQAAPVSPSQPYGFGSPVAPVYEATAAHDPFALTAQPNPMAAFGAAAGFGNTGSGESSAVLNPMAPINNSRSPLPGTSQSYVEEDSNFGSPLTTAKPFRIPRKESPVLYIALAGFAIVAIIGGLVASSMMGNNKSPDHTAQKEHPSTPKKPRPPEVLPVSTPADTKHEPAKTEPVKSEPAKPEMVKPEPPKPVEPTKKPQPAEPLKPASDLTDPEMPGPGMPKPEMPKPEVKKPEPPPEVKKPEPPKPLPAPLPAKATPDEYRAVVAKLAAARTLVGERKFSEAKVLLKEAGELAKTPDVQDLHEGMELATNYNEQFWNAVKAAMRTAQGEINIGSTPANIVSSDANEITIRMPGKNNTFTFDNLPPGLALALAKRWFDDKPANKAAIGSFYFASKNGNIDEARKFFEEAQNGGTDSKFILMLLDHPGILGK